MIQEALAIVRASQCHSANGGEEGHCPGMRSISKDLMWSQDQTSMWLHPLNQDKALGTHGQ